MTSISEEVKSVENTVSNFFNHHTPVSEPVTVQESETPMDSTSANTAVPSASATPTETVSAQSTSVSTVANVTKTETVVTELRDFLNKYDPNLHGQIITIVNNLCSHAGLTLGEPLIDYLLNIELNKLGI